MAERDGLSEPMGFWGLLGRAGALVMVLLVSGAADWPQFLGPERNEISSETGLAAAWSKQGPPLVWDKNVGAGFSGPVVAGKRLILFHRLAEQEVVQCLDAVTGKEQWKFVYPTTYQDDFGFDDGPRSTPLVSGNRVFTLGAAGMLHCLDLQTGKKIWARSINQEYHVPKGFFGVATSPLLEDNRVLINVGGKKAGIVAFAQDTGKEVWKATDHGASYSSGVAATINGIRQVFFFTRQGLVALNPHNGTIRFSKPWRSRMDASVNAATPVVIGDQVFISACYGTGAVLLRVSKDSAAEVWKSDDVMSNHYGTSIHRNGYLYGFDGRQEHGARLRCVEWQTGKIRWTKEGFGCGSMVLADGRLIVVTERGDLVLIEATPDAYREKCRAAVLAAPCRAPIALANGRLYARDSKKLICLNLREK